MKNTKIQWTDSTINPLMGCGGCELYLSAAEILQRLDEEISKFGAWPPGTSKKIYMSQIAAAYAAIKILLPGHSKALSTTNVWHLRKEFAATVKNQLGKNAAIAAEQTIGRSVFCYTSIQHLNKGRSIVTPERGFNKGYAPVFEVLTQFPGRVWEASGWTALNGQPRLDKPWLDGLPRHIFVSDMGDAFSRESDFGFLEKEVIAPVQSPNGQRHIWQWLTKRPDRMARFAEQIGGFPSNVIAMTTLTAPDTLDRVDALRRVPATKRGLSVEPLRGRILSDDLDLHCIDWVIVGGESGKLDCVHPFDLAWVRELRDHCQTHGVAFFCKQLGRRPFENGIEIHLQDGHGGNWNEWPEDLRIRDMPQFSEATSSRSSV